MANKVGKWMRKLHLLLLRDVKSLEGIILEVGDFGADRDWPVDFLPLPAFSGSRREGGSSFLL